MIPMYKADIRRLFRTRSLYANILIIMAIVLIAAFSMRTLSNRGDITEMTFMIEGINGSSQKEMQKIRDIAEAPGVSNFTPPENMRARLRSFISFEMLAKLPFATNLFFVLMPIVCVMYASKDYATGYLKNYLVMQNAKNKWLLSKMLTLPAILILFYIGIFLASAIGTLVLKNPFPESYADILLYIAKMSLPGFAFALFSLFLTVAFQSKTASLIVTLLLSFSLQTIIYALIDSINFLPFKLRDYAFVSLTRKLSVSGEFPPNLVIVSAAVAVLSIALSFIVMNRRDLKI